MIKGMNVHTKNNPFINMEAQTKRDHHFAKNVENNEAVAKKSGRTMASKTRHHTKSGKYSRERNTNKVET